MLDEPLGALDRALREQLMNELRAILKRVGVTALYVTHDQEEAFAVADRVLIMRAQAGGGRGRLDRAGRHARRGLPLSGNRVCGAIPRLQEPAGGHRSLRCRATLSVRTDSGLVCWRPATRRSITSPAATRVVVC